MRARAGVHVQRRPFPGATEPPSPAPVDAGRMLAAARDALADPVVEELPTGPTGEWETFRRSIGPCSVCGESCRSFDPEGRTRHWCCQVPA